MKIFLIGFMGSGKTYWGSKLSEKLTLPFFDLDEQIESNEGKPIPRYLLKKEKSIFDYLKKIRCILSPKATIHL